ncbi:MAG: divergent polysaccharide deacetylase family protein, partial [Beijerinckiaceae bacterium]
MTGYATDDLTRPLGQARRAPVVRATLSARTTFSLLTGVMSVILAAQIWRGQRPDESGASTIKRRAEGNPAESAQSAASRATTAAPEGDRPRMSAQEMENAAGVTVVRGGGSGAPESVVIQVQPERSSAPPPDRKLLERSRHGSLPRIGADGTRPSLIYARPAPADITGKPRIAILVGGLGVSQSATSDAIAKLPEAVSLAFAPYGGDLERLTQRARGEGHEIFLQAPMEPFD